VFSDFQVMTVHILDMPIIGFEKNLIQKGSSMLALPRNFEKYLLEIKIFDIPLFMIFHHLDVMVHSCQILV